jgi:hypothetical protein
MAEPSSDLLPFERKLSELLGALSQSETDEAWQEVASTAQVLANGLRAKDGSSSCSFSA